MNSLVILLDTNVILDLMLDRDGSDLAEAILEASIDHDYIECVTSTAITDIDYLVNRNLKDISHLDAQQRLKSVLALVEVLPVTENDIFDALALKWNDFEDAVQYCVAKSNLCDCIITNNTKDFKNADLDIFTPKEFIEKYLNIEINKNN